MSLEDYWNEFAIYPWVRNPQHDVGTYERCGKAIIAIDCFLILVVFICAFVVLISKPGKHKAKYWAFYLVLGTLFFRFLAGSILLGNPTEDAFNFMDKYFNLFYISVFILLQWLNKKNFKINQQNFIND